MEACLLKAPMSLHVKSRGCRLVELKTLKGSRLSRSGVHLADSSKGPQDAHVLKIHNTPKVFSLTQGWMKQDEGGSNAIRGEQGQRLYFWAEHGLANCRAPRN